MIKLFLRTKLMHGQSDKKLFGKIPILYCDYNNNLKLSAAKYVNLPMLSRTDMNPVLESYFTGYEGIANKLKTSIVLPELVKLFERYYIIFRNLIEEHHVKAIVLTGLVGVYEAALLQLSLEKNIPVYCCQHGIHKRLFPHAKLLSNVKFFASGKEEMHILISEGINKKNIIVTGSPFYDDIVKFSHAKKRDYVVVLTKPLSDGIIDEDAYVACLVNIKKDYKGRRIIAKMHPRDTNVALYRRFGFDIVRSSSKVSLYRLLASADLVIGFGSQAELEAMMLGVPIISNTSIWKEKFPYIYNTIPEAEQKKYIADNFILDGRSRIRMEAFLRKSV
jgi:hypothetical protein